jgi:predicted dienelactone hydrolase
MRILCIALLLPMSFGTLSGRLHAAYDPLPVAKAKPDQQDLTVQDDRRSRAIPIRVYFPKDKTPAPVVLFSHGLGGSREGCAYLGDHWAARGYLAVFLQHPGSDDAVWKDKPPADRMAALQRAVNVENFQLRVGDVPAVLDQLERWRNTEGHALAGRLDPKRVGMAGHSFGGWTTQALSGQVFPVGKPIADARIQAAAIMSPSAPQRGADPKQAFGEVKIPWMLLTGSKDVSPITNADVKSRLAIFPVLPPGGKYELVLDKAEHSAFGDQALPGDKEQRNPNHHRAVLAVTTAFWDAYLRDDSEAKKWLDGDAVRNVLEKDDHWQRK